MDGSSSSAEMASGTIRNIVPQQKRFYAHRKLVKRRTRLSPFILPKAVKIVQQGGQICLAKGDKYVHLIQKKKKQINLTRARDRHHSLPFAALLREALGLAETRRRRPVPKVDPELIRAIARIGSNLNQIARWLNTAQRQGKVSAIDAIAVSSQLVSLDRGLVETLDAFRTQEHGRC